MSVLESVTNTKLYTIKYIVIMEIYIADFYTSLFIPSIQNIALNLPHVRILGTHQCGNTHCQVFKRHSDFQDFLLLL